MCDCLLTKARLRGSNRTPIGNSHHYTGASHEESVGLSSEFIPSFSINQIRRKQGPQNGQRVLWAVSQRQRHLNQEAHPPRRVYYRRNRRHQLQSERLLLTERDFELMFKTQMGASADENDPNAVAYLTPKRPSRSLSIQERSGLQPREASVRNRSNRKSFRNRSARNSPSVRASSNKWRSSISAARRRPSSHRQWLENRLAFDEIDSIRKSSTSSISPMASAPITPRRPTISNTTSPSASRSSKGWPPG